MELIKDMNELKAMADRVRRSVVDMAHAAGAGGSHLGGGLSCVEIMTALYGECSNLMWKIRQISIGTDS